MVFNLSVGLQGIKIADAEKLKDPTTATYSLQLADTVAVTEDEPEVYTNAKRMFEDVTYSIGGEADDEDDEEEDDEMQRGVTKDRLREEQTEQQSLKKHQQMLMQKKLEEAQKKLSADKIGAAFDESKRADAVFKAYKNPQVEHCLASNILLVAPELIRSINRFAGVPSFNPLNSHFRRP